LAEEVEALAREIIGTDTNPEIQEVARRIAEAQIDLRRARLTPKESGSGHPHFAALRRYADARERDGISEFETTGAEQVRSDPRGQGSAVASP
jgi:hypothetical protein